MSKSPRVIRLTVINDLVSTSQSTGGGCLSYTCSIPYQVCPNCYIGHRELLHALATVAESNLPVHFEIEHRPFQLINKKCLCESKTVDKRSFYVSQLGEEKWVTMEKAFKLWTEEQGINM